MSLPFLLLLAASVPQTPAGTFPQQLQRAREASGFTTLPPDTHLKLRGTGELMGAPGTVEITYARQGPFQTALFGELSRYVTFDGERAWEREFEVGPYPLEFFGREWALLRAWVHSGYWLSPEAPLSIEPAEDSNGSPLFAVRLEDGKLTAQVELDPQSGLPSRLSLPNGNSTLQVDLDRYKTVGKLQLAHRVRTRIYEGCSAHWELTGAEIESVPAEARLAPPPAAQDTAFDPDVPAAVALLSNHRKHLFVRPQINGEEVGLFLFDTGAGFSGLNPEVAEELDLDVIGENSVTGLGGAIRPTRLSRVDSLQLGPLTIENLVMTQSGMGKTSEVNGERVVGVLGWDLLSRAVLDFDPRGGQMFLHDPLDPELSAKTGLGDAQWQPIHLHYAVPYVEMTFAGGHRGRFMVDTGAANFTVYFFADAARRLRLLPDGHEASTSRSAGAGGAFSTTLGHLDWIQFADAGALEDMTIVLGVGDDGELDPYSLGLLGGGVLRLYRLVIDYSRNRMAFVPL